MSNGKVTAMDSLKFQKRELIRARDIDRSYLFFSKRHKKSHSPVPRRIEKKREGTLARGDSGIAVARLPFVRIAHFFREKSQKAFAVR